MTYLRSGIQSGGLFEVDDPSALGSDRDLTTSYPGYSEGGEDPRPARAILFPSGSLVVQDAEGNSVTLTASFAGVLLPIQVSTIVASGSTATEVLIIW